MKYTKPPLSLDDQIKLLKQRGLIVVDEKVALHYLRTIGYYRLSGYMHYFYDANSLKISNPFFIPSTSFDDLIMIYDFDRELRNLTLDALEKIEITTKALISNKMSLGYGPFWYTQAKHFGTRFGSKSYSKPYDYNSLLKEIETARAPFLDHYRKQYTSSAYPPSWMALEVLSFGSVSILFAHLQRRQIKDVAGEFGFGPSLLVNWLQMTSHLRNICAHHARVWNRTFIYRIAITNFGLPKGLKINSNNDASYYAYACVIKMLLDKITLDSKWGDKLHQLIQRYPNIPLFKMSFPEDWGLIAPFRKKLA